jgi:hypothetical protein
MKTLLASLGIILIVVATGCDAARQTQVTELPIMIRVECRDEYAVRSSVVYLLKTLRPNDLNVKQFGTFLEIEAVYGGVTKEEIEKFERLEEQVKLAVGVSYVEMRVAMRPIRNDVRGMAVPGQQP